MFSISFCLGIPTEEKAVKKAGDIGEFDALIKHIKDLFEKYKDENAYALFNIITDMASNPPDNRLFKRDVNAMQRTAGAWVNNFRKRIQESQGSLNWNDYIGELRKQNGKANSENPYNG